jgi:hypothetical protein
MSKQPFQQDYSCIDKNPRAAEVLNALLAYARCPAARRHHLSATPNEMTDKGLLIQALVGAVVSLADSEGVTVTVDNIVRAEKPVTGVYDIKVETRWKRKIYQHYAKMKDPELRMKTSEELNAELDAMAQHSTVADRASKGYGKWVDVGWMVNGIELSNQDQVDEYVFNSAVQLGLELFAPKNPPKPAIQPYTRPLIINARPAKIELGTKDRSSEGDTMMAPVEVVYDSQIDEAAGAPLGVLADLPAAVDACLPALSSLSENERARASLKTMLGFAELIAKIKNGEEVDLSLVPPNALEAITKIMERGGVLYDRLMADSQRHSAAIGKEITENIRAHGSPLPPGDDTAPIAMGHPYAPYPRRNNPHIGSTLDSFLKDEGILESCTEAAKQAIAAGAATPVVMNNDGSLDYYPV